MSRIHTGGTVQCFYLKTCVIGKAINCVVIKNV